MRNFVVTVFKRRGSDLEAPSGGRRRRLEAAIPRGKVVLLNVVVGPAESKSKVAFWVPPINKKFGLGGFWVACAPFRQSGHGPNALGYGLG